ncbi:MAG TPA: efflux RND transporter periplasmic adaptor subunit [Patescibacteria group bacterium]|nr:efflux RND transporter periplasmic adaptor subunit [Patescibacteria group bacterium]
MHKKQIRGSLFSVGIFVATLLLGACGGPPGGQGDAKSDDSDVPVPVEAATAVRKAIVASYSGTAALEPENQAMVVAKTSGVLLKLMVEEGDAVRAGDLLAQLDPEKPRLELARAEANLKRLENDFRRSTDLYTRKLVSAEAQERARFDLETQKAVHDISKLELDYTRIIAPISGVISVRMVKEGNLIQVNQGLFRIDDFDPLLAVLNVPERELTTMRPGQSVSMHVDALPGVRFDGTVARVSPVVDAETGTFRVTTEYRDATQRLKSGMFGRVEIVYDQRADALVVPREALIEGDAEAALFVLEPAPAVVAKPPEKASARWYNGLFGAEVEVGKVARSKDREAPVFLAKRREVKVGYTSGVDAEITEGLKDGDRVVTIGKAALRDGGRVQIIEANSP